MRYHFFSGSKKLSADFIVARSVFRRGFGLMFRTRNAENLLFDFSKEGNVGRQLTAWFVFFPFFAVWLDKRRKIVDIRLVKPWEPYIHTSRPFSTILEFPVNRRNKRIISFFRRGIRKV